MREHLDVLIEAIDAGALTAGKAVAWLIVTDDRIVSGQEVLDQVGIDTDMIEISMHDEDRATGTVRLEVMQCDVEIAVRKTAEAVLDVDSILEVDAIVAKVAACRVGKLDGAIKTEWLQVAPELVQIHRRDSRRRQVIYWI